MQTEMRILILGGSNFMGKALIDLLSKQLPQAQIHIINRGKVYWNNQVYIDNPKIKYFYGDRKEHKQMHKAIEYLNEKYGISKINPWTTVVDFTSYNWRDVQSIAKALTQKTQLYIFISTDSIYNNSPYNGIPIEQEKFSIEAAYKEIKGRGKRVFDKYGYDKLKCEIYLQRRKHLPYINLRLPDVLGPYDNTNRYWCTLQWIKQSNKYPIEINEKDKKSPLSFVYSVDVAKAILNLIRNRETVDKYKNYNLAFRETLTYKQFIQHIARSMDIPIEPTFEYVSKEQTNGMYPSTDYTCINCDLAIKEIKWDPSSLVECIKESTRFFSEKVNQYPVELKEMTKEFKKKVIGKH